MTKTRYFVLDFETTGLSTNKSKIVQAAYMVIDVYDDGTERIISKYSSFCLPDMADEDWEEKGCKIALSVNGTSREFLQEFKAEVEVVSDIIDNFDFYKPDIICGQNVKAYDMNILNSRISELKIVSRIYNTDYPCYDTKLKCKDIDGTIEKSNLSYLCNHFGIQQLNAHCAMDDVECTWKVAKALMKLEREKVQQSTMF